LCSVENSENEERGRFSQANGKPYKYVVKGCLGSSGEAVYLNLDPDGVIDKIKKLKSSKQEFIMIQRYYESAHDNEIRCYCLRDLDLVDNHTPNLMMLTANTERNFRPDNEHAFAVTVIHPDTLNIDNSDPLINAFHMVPKLCSKILSILRRTGIVDKSVTPLLRIDCFVNEGHLVVNEIEWDWECYFFSNYHSHPLCKDYAKYAFIDMLECIQFTDNSNSDDKLEAKYDD
jgi:hypothetical protein